MIMFLNKEDLLKAKVLEGRFKIETYFPEYSSYEIPADSEFIIIVTRFEEFLITCIQLNNFVKRHVFVCD